ncbi:MAG: hypothetical protein AAFZ65_06060 [Planctomycetota bacterium]
MTALASWARLALPLLLALFGAADQGAPEVGAELHHKFGRAFLSSPNPGQLRNLRGRPVLLEWWRPECEECLEDAVPAALMLAHKHPELVVILIGAERLSRDRAERFAFDQGWMGGPALWTTDSPLREDPPPPPGFVLLDTRGRVLCLGNPINKQAEIARLVRSQIDEATRLPEDYPKALDKSWRALVEGDYGKASRTAQELAEDPGLSAHVLRMQAEILDRVLGEQAWIESLVAFGRYDEAIERLEPFIEGVERLPGWGEDAVALLAELESDTYAVELDASKRFAKLFAKVCERGIERSAPDLERFVEKHRDTVSGEHAAHLLSLLEG